MTQTKARGTPREAYDHLVRTHQLLGRQQQALDALIQYGPGTTGEIIAAGHLGTNTNGWRARFTELHARGLIREIGRRKCNVSGFTSLVWEPTGRMTPLDPEAGHVSRGPRAWRRLADEMAKLLDEIKAPKGTCPAHTIMLAKRRSIALSEYKRLGGKLA